MLAHQHLLWPSWVSQQVDLVLPDQHLGRGRMTEEGQAAGAVSVGAAVENAHQIPDLDVREGDVSGYHVEGGAARADQSHRVLVRGVRTAQQGHRIGLAEHLPEVPRGRNVMVHSAVCDHERLPARNLDIDHPRYVDACFSH